MISIIICSRNEEMLRAVEQNVAATIGVIYEIIAIDNKQGKYTIFEAYNKGVALSKYNVLCFMHEDIIFKTINWGNTVSDIFIDNPQFGLVGVAGSSYKTQLPSHWSFPYSLSTTIYVNIIQHYRSSGQVMHHLNNPRQERLSEVVSVDGVWFCAPKAVFDKVSFDDKLFTNFHCYDVDFSLSVKQYYKVGVTFDIEIEHLSEGSFNQIWLVESLKLHKKWQAVLPMNVEQLTEDEQFMEEKGALMDFTSKMLANKFYDSAVWALLWNSRMRTRFGSIKLLQIGQATGKELLKQMLLSVKRNK